MPRCTNGTRKNKKTGECEKNDSVKKNTTLTNTNIIVSSNTNNINRDKITQKADKILIEIMNTEVEKFIPVDRFSKYSKDPAYKYLVNHYTNKLILQINKLKPDLIETAVEEYSKNIDKVNEKDIQKTTYSILYDIVVNMIPFDIIFDAFYYVKEEIFDYKHALQYYGSYNNKQKINIEYLKYVLNKVNEEYKGKISEALKKYETLIENQWCYNI